MRFALLGPLVVADSSGHRVALGGPRLRILLAALLLRADMPVPASELVEMVWDGSPPPGPSRRSARISGGCVRRWEMTRRGSLRSTLAT